MVEIETYKNEMAKLKSFLERTALYNEQLLKGKSIQDIFLDAALRNGLESVLEGDKFYSIEEQKDLLNLVNMHPWLTSVMEDEIYAMAYSYGKLYKDIKIDILPIHKKILEMKQR